MNGLEHGAESMGHGVWSMEHKAWGMGLRSFYALVVTLPRYSHSLFVV